MDERGDIVGELESVAKGVLILSIGDFVYNIVLALGSIAIARLLGSEGYGLYSLVISIPLTIYSLINMNLDTGITRYIKLYLTKNVIGYVKEMIRISLLLKMLIGISGTLICFIYAEHLSMIIINRIDAYTYVAFVSIVVLLDSLYGYFLSIFIGFEETWRNSILKIVYSLIRTSLAILLLLLRQQVMGALTAYIIGLISSNLVGLVYLISIARHRLKSINKHIIRQFHIAKELITYSLPLYASSLVTSIISIYQTMLLARALTDIEIGGYRALANIQTLILVVLGPVATVLLPMYTKVNAEGDKEKLVNVLIISNRYTAIIIIPLTIASIAFSRELVYIFYGSEYVFASIYLPLLLAPSLLAGLGSVTIPQIFNAIGVTKFNMYTTIISAIIFMPLSYVMTMSLGYRLWGFLISNLIGNIISLILYNYLFIKKIGVRLNHRRVIGIYISSLVAIQLPILLLYIPLPRPMSLVRLVLGGIIYIVLYVIFSVIFKSLNEADLDFFYNVFVKIPIIGALVKPLALILIKFAKIIGKFVTNNRK